MSSAQKVAGLLAFAGSENTMGLAIVADAIAETELPIKIVRATESNATELDYLLVSLYWWKDFYEFVSFMARVGVDPRKRKPIIILGGMAALNPRPLSGYYHHAVIGDGEAAIGGLLRALESGSPVKGLPGVFDPDNECTLGYAETLRAKSYVDLRQNKTARIEIARGCKLKCAFCQLSALKPYRELHYDAIRQLVMSAETKTISLFAPDRWSHSDADRIETLCARLGKNNSGSDVRLDMIKKINTAARVRFGVEGFSEKTRKRLRKVGSNERLRDLLMHVMGGSIKTSTGKSVTSSTCYMIADLPGEGEREIAEFWGVLKSLDSELKSKHTMFLSCSSFAPSPMTEMQNDPINPYLDFKAMFERTRPRFEHIVIATRGGLIGPSARLAQMITLRGDERLSRVVYWLATKEKKLLGTREHEAGKAIEKACNSVGFDSATLYAKLPDSWQSPCRTIRHAQG